MIGMGLGCGQMMKGPASVRQAQGLAGDRLRASDEGEVISDRSSVISWHEGGKRQAQRGPFGKLRAGRLAQAAAGVRRVNAPVGLGKS